MGIQEQTQHTEFLPSLGFYVIIVCVMKAKFQGCDSIINGSLNLDSWSGMESETIPEEVVFKLRPER